MRQKACVSWNNIKTSYFSMSNGVKQGEVIYSIFKGLYIDPLLLELKYSGIGSSSLVATLLLSKHI